MPHVYAYVCSHCDHLSNQHALDEDGDLRDGPYRCQTDHCTCDVTQSSPTWTLATRSDYERWLEASA